MEFPAEIDHLPEMLAFIRFAVQQTGISEEKLYKVELASEEALVNIISYAYPEKKQNRLHIDCQTKPGRRFEVTIRDQGLPFNPIDADIDVDIHQPIEERKIGGLGIFMIRKLIDEVSYQRVGEENVFKMVTIL